MVTATKVQMTRLCPRPPCTKVACWLTLRGLRAEASSKLSHVKAWEEEAGTGTGLEGGTTEGGDGWTWKVVVFLVGGAALTKGWRVRGSGSWFLNWVFKVSIKSLCRGAVLGKVFLTWAKT